MPTNDQVSEETSAAQGTAEENPSESPQQGIQSDSLDAIQDLETLRERAKFLETQIVKKDKILERNKLTKLETPPPVPSQLASKDDLAMLVTNQAKELANDEVREHWDELSKIPLGGFNAMNARSIAENMAQRLVVFKSQQKPTTGAEDLTKSPGIRGTSGTASEVKKHSIPRLMDVDAVAAKLYN